MNCELSIDDRGLAYTPKMVGLSGSDFELYGLRLVHVVWVSSTITLPLQDNAKTQSAKGI